MGMAMSVPRVRSTFPMWKNKKARGKQKQSKKHSKKTENEVIKYKCITN